MNRDLMNVRLQELHFEATKRSSEAFRTRNKHANAFWNGRCSAIEDMLRVLNNGVVPKIEPYVVVPPAPAPKPMGRYKRSYYRLRHLGYPKLSAKTMCIPCAHEPATVFWAFLSFMSSLVLIAWWTR